MKPYKCCCLCKEYCELKKHKGFCFEHRKYVVALETGCNRFDRREMVSVDVFSYIASQLPPRTSLPELCELLGIKYGGDMDA